VNDRVKQTLMIVVAQTTCVAVALWMHHHFATLATREQVNENCFDELRRAATRLAGFWSAAHARPELSGTDFQSTAELLRHKAADQTDLVLVVDAAGNVLEAIGADGDPQQQRLEWEAPEESTLGSGEYTLTFLWQGQRYLGVRTATGEAGVSLIVGRPESTLTALTNAVVEPLTKVGALTLLWTCAMLSIGVYLILARYHDQLTQQRAQKFTGTLRRAQELVRTRDAVIFGLAKLADSRDPETGDHLERISAYSTTLASALRHHPRYGKQVTPTFIRLIGISSALHDIGKVGVADRILLKPGPLSATERKLMQTHCRIGGDCLAEIEQRLGSTNFLQMAREIALHHHERWDGTGYPAGLAGDEIPLSARIVAIADVYDALSSKRVYKERVPHEECAEILRAGAGAHFDPDLIEVWKSIEPKFIEIQAQYASTDAPTGGAARAGALWESAATEELAEAERAAGAVAVG